MKRNCKALLTLLAALVGVVGALAQGTAFQYQGHLIDGAGPANGNYDLRFTLYNDANTPGNVVVGAPVIHLLIAVNNGLFTTNLDFGSGVFTGPSRWLEIGARPGGSTAAYTVLNSRQELTPAPYAIYAENAGTANAVQTSSISAPQLNTTAMPGSGQVLGFNGSGLAWLNLGTAAPAWSLTGNAGTAPGANFLGTPDNQPLELHVWGGRALRIEPTGSSLNVFPNLIGGFAGNLVDSGAQAATIGGGGALGFVNQISATLGTIAGGSGNVIQSGANDSTIAGGRQNQVSTGANRSTVGGGFGNVVQTNASYATIPGGFSNVASGRGSFAAGRFAQATHDGDFVWSDGTQLLTDSGSNRFEILASGGAYFHNNVDVTSTVTAHSGVIGTATGGALSKGVSGSADGWGVYGSCSISTGTGVGGDAPSGVGVSGTSSTGLGVYGGSPFGEAGHFDGNVVINAPAGLGQTPLVVNGFYLEVTGWGNEQAYLGGDGIGNDVQIGSRNGSVTSVAAWNATTAAYMNFRCSSITIEGGSDLAEPFQISSAVEEIPQGAVVVIDERNPGHLKLSDRAYDGRVAGVVSGANGIHPGIQMQQQGLLEGGTDVALTGRVYVLADASSGPIQPGDLLTSSASPGRAMKASDHAKAQGAILGKAMSGLKGGRGLVLVLVTLQ